MGFTLVELIVIIVILGVLAAVAIPKFQNMSTSAQTAVVQGGAAAFASAAVVTFAKNNGAVPTAASVVAAINNDGSIQYTNSAGALSPSCPSNVWVRYTQATSVSVQVNSSGLSGYCNL